VAYKVFTNGSVLQASEINDNLMRQSVMVFSNAAARTAAITSPLDGMLTYLEDSKLFQSYNSISGWITVVNGGSPSFGFTGTQYYTSSATFTKATYPWLRALKIRVQAAGGGGGGCTSTGSSQNALGGSGSGGAYAELVTSDIAGLPSSVSITVGSGGSGGAAGNNAGTNGGSSSFGSICSANGGFGGNGSGAGGIGQFYNVGKQGGSGFVGQFGINGGNARPSFAFRDIEIVNSPGGDSFLSSIQDSPYASTNGVNAVGFGAGGGGAQNSQGEATAKSGGNGGSGIVIVELYA